MSATSPSAGPAPMGDISTSYSSSSEREYSPPQPAALPPQVAHQKRFDDDSDDSGGDTVMFFECVQKHQPPRRAVSISSCSETSVLLRRLATEVVDEDDDDAADGSQHEAQHSQHHDARRLAQLRLALESLDDNASGVGVRAPSEGVVQAATVSRCPVAAVTSCIGNLLVADRIDDSVAPILDVGSALVLKDGTFVGFVQATLGAVRTCSYVVALDNPRNGHGAATAGSSSSGGVVADGSDDCTTGAATMDNNLWRLKERLFDGAQLHSSSWAANIIFNPDALRGGATDASTVADVALGDNQRPDFSDDEDERAWKAAKKSERAQAGFGAHRSVCAFGVKGGVDDDVSSVSSVAPEEFLAIDEDGNVVAGADPSVAAAVTRRPPAAAAASPQPTSLATTVTDAYRDEVISAVKAQQHPRVVSATQPAASPSQEGAQRDHVATAAPLAYRGVHHHGAAASRPPVSPVGQQQAGFHAYRAPYGRPFGRGGGVAQHAAPLPPQQHVQQSAAGSMVAAAFTPPPPPLDRYQDPASAALSNGGGQLGAGLPPPTAAYGRHTLADGHGGATVEHQGRQAAVYAQHQQPLTSPASGGFHHPAAAASRLAPRRQFAAPPPHHHHQHHMAAPVYHAPVAVPPGGHHHHHHNYRQRSLQYSPAVERTQTAVPSSTVADVAMQPRRPQPVAEGATAAPPPRGPPRPPVPIGEDPL